MITNEQKYALLRFTEESYSKWKEIDPWNDNIEKFEEDLGLKVTGKIGKRVTTNYNVYNVYEVIDESKFFKNASQYPSIILEYKIVDDPVKFIANYQNKKTIL